MKKFSFKAPKTPEAEESWHEGNPVVDSDGKPEKAKQLKRNVTKSLSVKLTDDEVLKYGRELARAHSDRARIEASLDSIKAEYKGKITEQEGIIEKLSPVIHSGTESRDVKCEELKDWVTGTVKVTRLDTMEVIEDRPMREDEKQVQLL